MRSRHSRSSGARLACAALMLALCGLAAHAELAEWVRFIERGSPLNQVFFRPVSLPAGTVLARRPPRETRPALGALIQATPSQADLYALRARESELQLEFAAAESDWKEYAALVDDPGDGYQALAEFYRRRWQPQEEISTLLALGRQPSPPAEKFTPAEEQRSWQAFERIAEIIEAQALPVERSVENYRAWTGRYPTEQGVYSRFFDYLVERNRAGEAEDLLASYQQAFPEDAVFPVQARASLARQRGSRQEEINYYEQSFEPLWPPQLIARYFEALRRAGQLRVYLDRARSAIASNREDLKAAAWIYHYYQRQGDAAAAQAVLFDFRRNKESARAAWGAEELFTLAELFRQSNNGNEAARHYYALYSLPGAAAADIERALAGMIELLFSSPEQPIHFGSGDLSFYRDIATMDDHPGFLNGVLSLLFNSESPEFSFSNQERASVAYFHRAKAAELLPLFDSRFPDSPRRPRLHHMAIEAFATYGDNDGVIRGGQQFLTSFSDSPVRTQVSLLMAEAYARQGDTAREFAAYDALLEELAARAEGVPLGSAPQPAYRRYLPPPAGGWFSSQRANGQSAPQGPRSPEYARVLDRYIARLVSLQRVRDALALYARELSRNPDDPGLYERLANFLDQNRMGTQVEQVYRRAMGRFPDRSWHHRLASWYLREQRTAEFERLTREVTDTFKGSELDEYFQSVPATAGLDAALYRQVNLYAHQRFPYNPTFVRNLLNAYRNPRTRNAGEEERLLRQYWFFDESLRAQFFEFLSRTERLEDELDALRASATGAGGVRGTEWDWMRDNPAAVEYAAEAEIWRCHFEEAAPLMRMLASERNPDHALPLRAASLYRSLAYEDRQNTQNAVSIIGLDDYNKGTREQWALIGDIWAEGGNFVQAKYAWDDMPQVEPGKPEGYLEAATVYWDYYLFDEALAKMREARERFGKPALFAYEAGAIYENKRDYSAAITEYVQGALAEDSQNSAFRRLVRLSRRQEHRETIDQISARLAAGQSPSAAAVSLRVAVLEAQERYGDLGAFLARLAGDTTSFELLDRVTELASTWRLDEVRVAALERRIELTNDPVDRMRLRLALMRTLEGAGKTAEARQVVEALYRENPRILGVVRGAADFHWRNKDHGRALAVLSEAAEASYPDLRKGFTVEASRKASEAGQYDRARALLAPLIEAEPFNTNYLMAMADTYRRENRTQDLRDFHAAKIEAAREADIPLAQKTRTIAELRRAMIPALTALGEHSEAIDQYIEVINRFPEDEDLVREAAWYADQHGLRARLTDAYVKTTTESPRDARYHVVLARLHAQFEDLPAAIEAYNRAAGVRPDRTDILIARASIEERLLRFDDAAATYEKLYELAYQDPAWMLKPAEAMARQQRPADTLAALRKALIEGRPERPDLYREAASRLEQWGMPAEAGGEIERAVELAGDGLLGNYEYGETARLYARVMTRLRRHEQAFQRLRDMRNASQDPGAPYQWGAALQAMGDAAAEFFTPEEKESLAAFLEREKASASGEEFDTTLLALARNAGLWDLEVRWRHERMLQEPGSDVARQHQSRISELQKQRFLHNELGAILEDYWEIYPGTPERDAVLREAAAAYADAGNENAEYRALGLLFERSSLGGDMQERYFELLRQRDPNRLVAISDPAGSPRAPDAAANYAVIGGDAQLALRAVDWRGKDRPPVWTKAYTGLAGLYQNYIDARVENAFSAALGPRTVGEQVGRTVDRDAELAGDLWFYYGSRFGEYLGVAKNAGSADFLPAMVEAAPARASAYLDLADAYRDIGQPDAALADYRHALELDPRDARPSMRMADVLWEQDRRREAREQWHAAIEALTQQLEDQRISATFWEDLPALIQTLGQRGVMEEFDAEADNLLKLHARRNGGYRAEPLLRTLFESSSAPAAALDRIFGYAAEANNPVQFLTPLAGAEWLPAAQRESLLQRIVQLARREVEQSQAQARYYREQTLNEWQIKWIEHLVETRQGARARTAIAELSGEQRASLRPQIVPLEIQAAAQTTTLGELLAGYGRENETPPDAEALRDGAARLRAAGDAASARQVLEAYYAYRLSQHDFSATNLLGLAEIRLEEGRADEALALLRRVQIVGGEPFEQLQPAAVLLTRFNRHSDAVAFLTERVRAVPWDAAARVALGRANQAAGSVAAESRQALASVAGSTEISYDVRADAAKALSDAGGAAGNLGSGELNWLANAQGSVADAEKPYFHAARLTAADRSANAAEKLRLVRGALAARTGDEAAQQLLFQAARAAGDHRLAVLALDSFLERSGWGNRFSRADSIFLEDPTAVEVNDWLIQSFTQESRLNVAEAAQAARALSNSLAQLRRYSAAVIASDIAFKLEVDAQRKASDRAESERLRTMIERRAENAKRRPRIHDHLDQDHLVRPRLALAGGSE